MLLAYTWTRNNIDVTIDPRFSVLTSGSMFIRETTGEDAGVYVCVARTLSDRTLSQVYRGREVNLDVLCEYLKYNCKTNSVVVVRTAKTFAWGRRRKIYRSFC